MATIIDMAPTFKTALVSAWQASISALPDDPNADGPVLVAYGHPGPVDTLPTDVVSVGRVSVSQVPGPLGPRRQRDITLTATVISSVHRPGGWEQEQIAGDRAYQLLGVLEEYVRVTDTTLGGLVWWCFCTGHDSEGSTDPAALKTGRTIEVTATFVAQARITS